MTNKTGKKRLNSIATAALILFSICSYAVNAAAATTSYRHTSEPGDYIGAGLSESYTSSNATLVVNGTAAALTFSVDNGVDWWYVNLSAPKGETLHPGVYYNAERSAFRTGRAPGLDVYGNGRGCNKVWGAFSINQIATNTAGAITLLDASFTQNCESKTAPALIGVIKYNAEPLAFSYISDAGDYIGQGLSNSYQGANSTFTLSGNANTIQYGVSGKRNTWNATIGAPTGQQLQVGTFNTARFADATHARLDFTGNGRGCNSSSGTLKINAITFDGLGKITGLNANFVQYCDGDSAALRGTIRYYK